MDMAWIWGGDSNFTQTCSKCPKRIQESQEIVFLFLQPQLLKAPSTGSIRRITGPKRLRISPGSRKTVAQAAPAAPSPARPGGLCASAAA